MPQLRDGHQQRPGSARRTGNEQGQGYGSTPERQEGWLPEGQAEEKETRTIVTSRRRGSNAITALQEAPQPGSVRESKPELVPEVGPERWPV